MSRRDPNVVLRHILESAEEALLLATGRSRPDLDTDRMLNLSLVRLLEITGEAATRIPPEMRARHPTIPWAKIVGLRNRLIHGYDAVDFDVVWAVIRDDLPVLVGELRRILYDQGSSDSR